MNTVIEQEENKTNDQLAYRNTLLQDLQQISDNFLAEFLSSLDPLKKCGQPA